MANTVDFALLVGKKRSEPILEGLKDGGFDMNNARVFHTLNEATQAFGEMSRPGAVSYTHLDVYKRQGIF